MLEVNNKRSFGHQGYQSRLVTVFGIIGAINLFNLAVCVVLFSGQIGG
ncbi:MAG: hypothetical protein OEZ43_20325 [Gammaproteobacteria bacterium]|nr:hypothetical protein [Gammaproteobacteria bacterium]